MRWAFGCLYSVDGSGTSLLLRRYHCLGNLSLLSANPGPAKWIKADIVTVVGECRKCFSLTIVLKAPLNPDLSLHSAPHSIPSLFANRPVAFNDLLAC